MTVLSQNQVGELVWRAGFADPQTAIAVVMGESGGETTVVNDKNTDGSIDRGLWQINSVHLSKDLTIADMFDVTKSTAFALKLSKGGTDFNPWTVTRSDRWPELYAAAASSTPRPAGLGDIAGTIPVIGGAAETVIDTASGVVDFVADPLGDLGDLAAKALSVLTSADFWKRAGFAFVGVVLVVVAGYVIFGGRAIRTASSVAGAADAVAANTDK